MSTYSQIVAASLLERHRYSVPTYTRTLGDWVRWVTLAVAVYSRNEQRLVGFAGADVTARDVIDAVGSEEEARNAIREESNESRECKRFRARDDCELQALGAQKNSAICANALPGSGGRSWG